MAAKYDNFECLKYAHENGCEWNATTFQYAEKNNHIKCINYLITNNCPISFISKYYSNDISIINSLKRKFTT